MLTDNASTIREKQHFQLEFPNCDQCNRLFKHLYLEKVSLVLFSQIDAVLLKP